MELRRQLFGQRLSPVNQRDGRGIRVDGADDIPNLGLIGWRRILVMNPGPHGTSHIMEHFGSDGPKQKTAESAVSVGRHDDQVRVDVFSEFSDLLRRISRSDDAALPRTGAYKFAQLSKRSGNPGVKIDRFRPEFPCEAVRVPRRPRTARGKINRY